MLGVGSGKTALVETLCAVALSAPSKSDLQQADILDLGHHARLEPVREQPVVDGTPEWRVIVSGPKGERGRQRTAGIWYSWIR